MTRDDDQGDKSGRNGEREKGEGEPFDAVGAAEELDEILGASGEASAGGESDTYIDMLEGELAAVQGELVQARAQAETAVARAGDAAADVERAKERVRREAERDRDRQLHAALQKFLEVLDDLDRAIASAREMDHNPEVLAGVDLVRKRFLSVLAGFGVRHAPALGERFDPAVHEAVSTMPVADRDQDGVVVGVVSEGYLIGDEVLRPARVAVGKAG